MQLIAIYIDHPISVIYENNNKQWKFKDRFCLKSKMPITFLHVTAIVLAVSVQMLVQIFPYFAIFYILFIKIFGAMAKT